jgi:hypothetical protein
MSYFIALKEANNPCWNTVPTKESQWDEICKIVTGKPTKIPDPPATWAKPWPNPLVTKKHQALTGETVLLAQARPGLPMRKGTIRLVAGNDTSDRTPSVLIEVHALPPPDPQTPCQTCNKIRNKWSIACDDCNAYHHTDCVGWSSSKPVNTWYCSKCSALPHTGPTTQCSIKTAHQAMTRTTQPHNHHSQKHHL